MANNKNKMTRSIWKRIISHNMLPVTEDDFYVSEWPEWLDRINAGFELEKKRINKLANGASQEYSEALGEDYWQAEQISNNMNAALIVAVWAKIENFLRILCRYCKSFGKHSIKKNADIRDYAEYFKVELKIDFQSINNIHAANCVRILSNAFKHNGCYYIPDGFPIDEILRTKYEISKDSGPIKYIKLPIKELILNAGAFCHELFNNTDTALKQ
jgi:uncharacterized Fe-S cluster protein YjdI